MKNEKIHYAIVKRQINKVKGYEISFSFSVDNKLTGWGTNLGFFKTMKEVKQIINEHKKNYHAHKTKEIYT
jgi:hypothetical protein